MVSSWAIATVTASAILFAALDPSVTASIISSTVVLIGILLTFWRSRVKQEQIHVLVNSRLDAALKEIRLLKDARERDEKVLEAAKEANERSTEEAP